MPNGGGWALGLAVVASPRGAGRSPDVPRSWPVIDGAEPGRVTR